MALSNFRRWALNAMSHLRMRQQGLIHLPPLQFQEFHELPAGFEYPYKIKEAFNRAGFAGGVMARDSQQCVVCGLSGYRKVHPVHVIKQDDEYLVKADCIQL